MSAGDREGASHRTGGDGRPDYAGMERDIRDSREHIGEALGELKGRLSPRHIKESTMNRMTYRANRASSSMGGVVRNNPLPLAMIGLGLGWLLLSQSGYDQRIARSRAVGRMTDRAGRYGHSIRESLHEATGSVREGASHLYGRANQSVRHAAERVSGHGKSHRQDNSVYPEGAHAGYGSTAGTGSYGTGTGSYTGGGQSGSSMGRRMGKVTHGFWDMVDDHPLVAGVMGVALGAALGASIPSTRYEGEWMGEYADEAYDRVKTAASDTLERGTRAATAAYEAAREDIADAVGDAKDAAREEMKRS